MSESPEELQDRRETIFEFGEMLMAQIKTTFNDHGITLPSKQFFDTGPREAPHDCEQLSIAFEQMYNGTAGVQDQVPTHCNGPRTLTFVVELVRCTPLMERTARGAPLTPPDEAKLNATAKQQWIDAWLLMDAGLLAGEAFSTGALADVGSTPESGGFQAVVLNVTLGTL